MQTKGEKEKVKSEEEERWRREENKVELLVFTLSFFKCSGRKGPPFGGNIFKNSAGYK